MSADSRKDNGGAAFPKPPSQYGTGSQDGMNLRDYFAASALNGFLANSNFDHKTTFADAADHAFAVADAMLAARKEAK